MGSGADNSDYRYAGEYEGAVGAYTFDGYFVDDLTPFEMKLWFFKTIKNKSVEKSQRAEKEKGEGKSVHFETVQDFLHPQEFQDPEAETRHNEHAMHVVHIVL